MTNWWQMLVLGGLIVTGAGLIWVGLLLRKVLAGGSLGQSKKGLHGAYADVALEETGGLFNKEFHEELRNRGRLHFEKIITENAMFLKQDLDMTIAQLNEYLKKEIGGKLNEEFADYTKAMQDAQQLALDSLHKSATAVEEQRVALVDTLQKDVADREALLLQAYEQNLAKITEHYILEALGDQFDLKSQLPYIISQMEANKKDILDDMRL